MPMQKSNIRLRTNDLGRITSAEIAAYAEEMLESLRKLTDEQGLQLLSQLLAAAALEARNQARRAR